jgi:hypothetical protein
MAAKNSMLEGNSIEQYIDNVLFGYSKNRIE